MCILDLEYLCVSTRTGGSGMHDFLDKAKEVFDREWSGEEKVLIMLCCVLLGVIYGFLISPIKKGISVGNNNGNNYNEFADDYWLDDEE